MKERKDVKGLIKYLRGSDDKAAIAAIGALDEIKESLKDSDWKTLRALKGTLPHYEASKLSWLLVYPQSALSRSFASVRAGMSVHDVIRIMGKPDRNLSGREFVQAYQLGVITSGGDTAWLSAPHWIYAWKDDPRSCYVIEFKGGVVEKSHSIDKGA